MSHKNIIVRWLLLLSVCQLLVSCDPADIREMNFSVPGGEQQMRTLVNASNFVALRHSFRPDKSNGTFAKVSEGELLAVWRRKLNPNDETTRIACFVFFNRATNSGKMRLVLFPGAKLPPDTIVMFQELKACVEKSHIIITPGELR